ncbi:tol-pal system protein YbgF [Thiohalobacter sp. IOR34]|uniref:tol-pal system protein YbgF n=1 Tax=Thiohalobacter sp. IOR34 TaxID=3057176 RepID=UPI0025AEE773|nr:tol-pal system protein YbgF [Thiohalobacter sp. IOR34]WJW74954.1 tol-pal system protein YbgF [Thiohalobacter sp. IOR34]
MGRGLRGSWLLVLALLAAAPAQAREADLEQRVQRLERLLQSRGLIEMLTQLEQLQREVQSLRGEVEMQGHELEQLKARQRDLYVDIDRRLQRLEAAPAQPVTPPAAAPALPAPPPAAASAVPGTAPAAASPATPAPAADPEQVRQAYEQALNILREGRYAQAGKAYRRFLAAYPDSAYAGNAQYWLAETYYVSRQFDKALAEFEKVVKQYPASSKVPDALLKMGFIQYELKQWDAARRLLEQVQKDYPRSTAARLAGERLARMRREGH